MRTRKRRRSVLRHISYSYVDGKGARQRPPHPRSFYVSSEHYGHRGRRERCGECIKDALKKNYIVFLFFFFVSGESKIDCEELIGEENASSSSLDTARTRLHNMSTRKFSDPFHSITELCLQRNPCDRPTMSQLLAHPFFKQCRKNDETLNDILRSVTPINEKHVHSAGESEREEDRLY